MKIKISVLFLAIVVSMMAVFSSAEAAGLTYVYKANVEHSIFEQMDVNSKVIKMNKAGQVFFAQDMQNGWLHLARIGYIEAKHTTRQKGLYYMVNSENKINVFSQPSKNSDVVAQAYGKSIVVKFNDVPGGWSAVNYGGEYGYVPTALLKQPTGKAVTITNKAGAPLRKIATPSAKVVATIPVQTSLKVYSSFSGWSFVANHSYSGYVKTQDIAVPQNTAAPVKPTVHTKKIALTFDDGPSSTVTPQILKTLKKYGVKATFFTLGSQVQKNPKLAKQIVNEGHQIANHSWNHRDLSKMSLADVKADLVKTNAAIEKATGVKPTIYRPPYGALTKSMRKNIHFKPILWTVDTLDWQHRNPTKTLAYVKKGAKDGGIILMHDIHQQTANALANVIVYLQEQGYTFVTIDEL